MIKNNLGRIDVFLDPKSPQEQRHERLIQDRRDFRNSRLATWTVLIMLVVFLTLWWKLVYQPALFCHTAAQQGSHNIFRIQQGIGVGNAWNSIGSGKKLYLESCLASKGLELKNLEKWFVTPTQFTIASGIEFMIIFFYLLAFGDKTSRNSFKVMQSTSLTILLISATSLGLAYGVASTLGAAVIGLIAVSLITQFKFLKSLYFFLGLCVSIYFLLSITQGGLS